jgi:uncharacterized protein
MSKTHSTPYGLLEFKQLTTTITDVDTKNGIVTGVWSKMNVLDYDEDIIRNGAFTKTIAERGPNGTNEIFFLNQHNWSQPLGKPTLLAERGDDLYHETPVNANTTFGKDALELMGSGLVIQNSIGYMPVKWSNVVKDGAENSWDTYREITEIKLYEGSCVTLGANSQTPFTGFKSMTPQQINDQVSIMMKLLRNGTLTDETFGLLEIAIKQYGTHLYELGKKSLVDDKAANSTLDVEKPVSVFAGLATDNQKSVFTFNHLN